MFTRRSIFLVSVSLVILMVSASAFAGVVPPNSRKYGMNYSELSARWWQWALGIPADQNPILDTTGEHCAVGQMGPVWFLAGTFGTDEERDCTIPADKAILIPVINAEMSEVEEVNGLGCGFGTSEADLRACAVFFMDHVTRTEVTIDGKRLKDKDISRVESPLFTFLLPDDNILGIEDPFPNPSPPVADGFYVVVDPLSPGSHIIRLKGVAFFPEFGDFEFETEVTYHLTIE